MTPDDAITKIRKLLAQAEPGRGATQAEAETAAALAATLMSRFGIEAAAVLEGEQATARPIVEGESPESTWSAQADTWRGIVSGGVCSATRTKCYWSRKDRNADPALGIAGFRDRRILKFIGTAPNVAAACYLYASICNQVERLAELYAGRGRAWLNSYRIGVAAGVSWRMRQAALVEQGKARAEAAAGAVSTGTALLRLDHEVAAVQTYYGTLGLRHRSHGRPSNVSGYGQGKADSSSVRTGGGPSLGAGSSRIGEGQRRIG